MEILEALGVVVVLSRKFLTDAFKDPARALSSCLAVIPRYLLARDPAVIAGAFELVLAPSMVLTGRASSSLRVALETVRVIRPGVVVLGRDLPEGVILPLRL